MGVLFGDEGTSGLEDVDDRLWIMRWTRRADRTKDNLSVIGMRPTVPMRPSAS
jgi:hypothetical protein